MTVRTEVTTGTTAAPKARLPREVWVLAGLNVCIGIGYGVAAPVIPLLAKAFGVSNLAASMVISVYGLARVVTSPIAARFAMRWPPGPMIAISMAGTALTSMMAGLSGSFAGLLIWRGLAGATTATSSLASQNLMYLVSPAGVRGRVTALFHSGFLVGAALGPVIGGAVAELDLSAPLLIYSGLVMLGALGALVFLRGKTRSAGLELARSRQTLMPMREALRDTRYRVVLTANLANAWVGNGIRFTVVPLYVSVGLGLGPLWTGIGLLVAALTQIALTLPAGAAVDRWGSAWPLRIGLLLTGIAALLPVFLTSPAVFLCAMALWGIASALTTPSTGALLGDVLAGRGGQPLAWFQMVFDLATILTPLISGLLADEIGFGAAFLVAAVVCLVAAVSAFFLPRLPRNTAAVVPAPAQPE